MIKKRFISFPILLFLTWTLATYLLEGHLHTFLKPDAVIYRIIYILVANLLIGIVLSVIILRKLIKQKVLTLQQAGFRSLTHTLISIIVGFVLGMAIYFLQNPPTTHPVIIINAFFQVLSVSAVVAIVILIVTHVIILNPNIDRSVS